MPPRPSTGFPLRVVLLALIAGAAAVYASLHIAPIKLLLRPRPTRPVAAAVQPATPLAVRTLLPTPQRPDAASPATPVITATRNAERSHEALVRARAAHDAWLARRFLSTGLYPRDRERPVWSYRDVAADFFGHQLNVALLTQSPALEDHLRTLAAERAATPPGQLCQDLDAATGRPLPTPHRERLFGTAEYAKDGLLSVVELTNHPAARARLVEIADALLAASSHPSRAGPIPDRRSEVNGDMLQILCRLALATGEARYADMAGRIADAAITQMLPANHGLPVLAYDYDKDATVRGSVQIRDHGNELLVGLGEAYALAVHQAALGDSVWRDRADRWAAPLARMYAIILEHARTPEGLLADAIDPSTLTPGDAGGSDNWGYVVCGAELFCQAAERHTTSSLSARDVSPIRGHIASLVEAVLRTNHYPWEGEHQDGYADSLESAIYAAAYCPTLDAGRIKAWIDDQIPILFAKQRADGFVDERWGGGYLDGNFMRTSLLYALMCSGGWTASPWSPDVGVGYTSTRADHTAGVLVIIAGPRGWEGVLRPSTPRHRQHLNLPWNWPRINSWPEWHTLESIAEARIVASTTDRPPDGSPADTGTVIDVATLAQGLPLKLAPFERAIIELKYQESTPSPLRP